MNMKKVKKFEEFDRVDLFKKKFISKDYYGACNIVLSGWGTKELPLNKDEHKLIDKFINSRSKNEQEEYDNAMRGVQGTFG